MDGFDPLLRILPPPQRRLWEELVEIPPSFALYGGTAIALRLGHRDSIDFDFFAPHDIEPRELAADLAVLRGATVMDMEPNTLTVAVDRGGEVKLSFFGVPRLGRVAAPERTRDIGLGVASLLDLGGTKVSVVQVRAEPKDYIDVDALLGAGVPLPDMLAAGSVLYGEAFSAQSALKALVYFNEPALMSLAANLKDRLRRAVRDVDLDRLPSLQPWNAETARP